MQTLANGTTLGGYTILRLIGRGGMGEVYEAYEAKLHRRVALKVIAPNQPDEHDLDDLFRRFVQEARTLAQVNHPNIVTIYDIDRQGDAQFIAMEFVPGLSLKQILKETTVTTDEALPIFAQILDGLTCLHDNHIIHRDLKPHNILVRKDGQVKILDFGIAKQMIPGLGDGTVVGVIAGTLPYMAPEVRAGERAHPGSDLWSLGAIFYEILVGKPLAKVMLDHSDPTMIPFTKDDIVRIPQEMRSVIQKMCAYNPQERYSRAADVTEDLKKFRQNRPSVPPEVYQAFVGKIATATEQLRKESGADNITFPSIKTTPASTQTRASSDRRKARRKSKKGRQDYLAYALGFGTPLFFLSVWGFLRLFTSDSGHTPASVPPPPSAPVVVQQAPAPAPAPIPSVTVVPTPPPAVSSPPSPGATVALLEPKNQATLWLPPRQNPTLNWSRPLSARDYHIQIATDANFRRVIISEPANGNSYHPERTLPDGTYYWRLNAQPGAKPELAVSQFTLSRLSPVDLIEPNTQHVFELRQKEKLKIVTFAWKCKSAARLYRLQVSPNSDFEGSVKEKVISDCNDNADPLTPGTWYWRVRVEGVTEYADLWSETRSLVVKAAPTTKVKTFEIEEPKLKTPFINLTLDSNSKKGPDLTWTPIKGAKSYVLQFSGTKEFSHLLSEEKTSKPSFTWKNPPPGKTFWRVRAMDATGSLSNFSGRGVIVSQIGAPELKPSYKLSRNPSGGEPPKLTWTPISAADKYIVQISKTADFADAEEEVVDSAAIALADPPGSYFIKIASANSEGEPVGPFSKASALKIEATFALEKPKALTPATGARAPASDGRLSAKFSWSPISGAEVYSIDIAADPEFTQTLQKLRTPQTSYLLKQARMKGRVYWRVRAESSKGPSEWSETSYFDVH